jgi:hypothetical protein
VKADFCLDCEVPPQGAGLAAFGGVFGVFLSLAGGEKVQKKLGKSVNLICKKHRMW